MLTITIPTFNRNEILLENVRRLLPQMTPECQLIILDNASDVPVLQTLEAAFAQFPEARCTVVRNRVNIGANANILRCFEQCETPFLWLLGDDDTPQPNAIEVILRHIEAHPNTLYFNFLANYVGFNSRVTPIWTRGLSEFVDKVDSIANILFISSGVYHIPSVNKNLHLGYAYLNTQPNFIPLLTSLGKDGVCCLSHEQIVIYNPPPPNEEGWSIMFYGMGVMALLELPMPPDVRVKLALKILDSMRWQRGFTWQLVLLARRERSARGALFLYDQLCYRIFYFERTPRRKLQIALFRLLIKFYQPTYRLMSLSKRWKKRK